MTSGPGRPGQPMPGQRSIFGTGRGPVFAQMPAYKPVTRGSEPQPQAPEPPQPDFGAYARQGVEPGVSGYANQNGASSYQTPSAPPRSYTAPDFPNPFPPQQTYQPQPQSYQPQPQQNYKPQQSISRSPNSPTRASYQPQPPGQSTSRPRSEPSRSPIPAQPSYQPEPPRTPSRMRASRTGSSRPKPRSTLAHAEQGYDDTNYAERELSATHPSRMRASPTPLSRMQVSPRRRPSRITPQAPAHHDAFGVHDVPASRRCGRSLRHRIRSGVVRRSIRTRLSGRARLSFAGRAYHAVGRPASSAVASGSASLRCRLRSAAADRARPHAISKPDAAAERASGFL